MVVAPSRALRIAGWLFGAGLRIPLIWLAVGLVIQVAVIAALGYWPLLGTVLLSWRTVLLVALVLGLDLLGRIGNPGALGARWAQWLAALLVVGVVVAGRDYHATVNPLGLLADPPNSSHWTDRGHRHRPPALVRTNRYGFRDRNLAAAPAPGSHRVIVVGDSYAYGKGVPEEEGLIHNQLAGALAVAAPAARFEVLNAGYPGWGYFTYFDAARRVLHELHPRVIVIGSLGGSDWDLFDHQQQWSLVGRHGFFVLANLGVVDQLKEASTQFHVKAGHTPDVYQALPGAARLKRLVLNLLADAERQGCDVVLWDYYEPIPFFDEFTRHSRFHRAGWPPTIDRRWDGWGRDPRLAVPVDRHPTGAGNALVARHLAPSIVAALGLAGASGPASVPAATPRRQGAP